MRFLRILARIVVAVLVAAAIYYIFYKRQSQGSQGFLRVALANPFILAGLIGLYIRMFVVDYFHHRLAREPHGAPLSEYFLSSYTVPKLYRERFGTKDLLYRFYSWSIWIFLFLFLLGAFMVQAKLGRF